jgi:hypothetical protein
MFYSNVKGGFMIKQNRIAQIYGYLVCLVAVITVLICSAQLINALLDKSDPMHARERTMSGGQNLTTFEVYKMDKLKSTQMVADSMHMQKMADDAMLHSMYQAERDDLIASVNHRTTRDAIVNSLLLMIAVLLFVFHWRWLRKMAKEE